MQYQVCIIAAARSDVKLPKSFTNNIFTKELKMDVPDNAHRISILTCHLARLPLTAKSLPNQDVSPAEPKKRASLESIATSTSERASYTAILAMHLSKLTSGFSPRNLSLLCREAYFSSATRCMVVDTSSDSDIEWAKDFAPALKKIRPADLLQFDVALPYTPWEEFCGWDIYF